MQPQRATRATHTTTTSAPARLVAGRGRFPWNGHFRVATGDACAKAWLAGRVRPAADPVATWKRIEEAVVACSDLAGTNRDVLSQRVWAAVSDHVTCAILVAQDAQGAHVEALNLAGVVAAGPTPRALATAETLGGEGLVRLPSDHPGPFVGWSSRDRLPEMDASALDHATGHVR